MGGIGRAKRRVALVAGLAALGWLSRPFLEWLFPEVPLSERGIAMLAGIALFVLPDGHGGHLLDYKTASGLRWDLHLIRKWTDVSSNPDEEMIDIIHFIWNQ